MNQKRTQMVDIARLAGVSLATVSRALSGSNAVTESTRNRIVDLARSLNYAVNVDAKNLRRGNTNTIGVVIPLDAKTKQHISDPFFLSLLGSIADALTERHLDMLVSRVDSEHLDALAQLYDSGRVMGVIVVGQWEHHDQLNLLAARKLPMAVWGAALAQQLYCSVGSNNQQGGYLAVQHLLEQGRQRIVFLGDTHFPEVAQRHAGYVQALGQAACAYDPHLILPTPFAIDLAEKMLSEFLASGQPFDAIFAASDVLAMTAMRLMQLQGIRVPEDVAVVGYDDIAVSALVSPSLSTVCQPIALAGQELVSMVLKLIEGHRQQNLALPTELIIRGSSQKTLSAGIKAEHSVKTAAKKTKPKL
jgi:DNA-binding LacI/PurR family transcriptional regulator